MPATVTSKGQVTIPKPVRDLLGLRTGSKVSFRRMADGRVELVAAAPEPSVLARYRGQAGSGMSTDEIMALTRGGA